MLLLVPEALLGWQLLSHRPVGEKWRGLLWILATFFATAFASTLPRTGSWPLPTGLGGVFGDALLNVPAFIMGGPLDGFALFAASVALGVATLLTLAIAAGLRWPRSDAAAPVVRDANFDDEMDDDAEDAEDDRV
jgi:S-DNA-T family DNA segregation ATPase FtsK/SpoIIIE